MHNYQLLIYISKAITEVERITLKNTGIALEIKYQQMIQIKSKSKQRISNQLNFSQRNNIVQEVTDAFRWMEHEKDVLMFGNKIKQQISAHNYQWFQHEICR